MYGTFILQLQLCRSPVLGRAPLPAAAGPGTQQQTPRCSPPHGTDCVRPASHQNATASYHFGKEISLKTSSLLQYFFFSLCGVSKIVKSESKQRHFHLINPSHSFNQKEFP